MKYALAQRGSMPLRNGSDVPYLASEVSSMSVPAQPKAPPRPTSSATNIVQALADKFGITAIPQSILSLASGIGSIPISSAYGIYKGVTSPNFGTQAGVEEGRQASERLQQAMTYEPTSQASKDINESLAKALEASKLPPYIGGIPRARPILTPNDVRVMGANAKRVAGEVGDIKADFVNAQSGIRRQNIFDEPTLGVKAERVASELGDTLARSETFNKVADFVYPVKRIDVGQKAKNYSKASEDIFKREFTVARQSGKTVDEANITAWRASQLDDVPEGAPGSLGTRYLPMTDRLVQESMLGELEFEPKATPRKSAPKDLLKTANDLSMENFGTKYENLTPEQKVQLRDYALALRTVGKSANLPAALEAYPEIADYRFEYKPTRDKVAGGFGRTTKAISVESPKREAAKSTIHELQHGINDIEGLPQGANTAMFDLTTAQGRKYQDYVGKLQDEKEALMHAGFIQKKATEFGLPLEEYIKQNNAEIDSLFQKEKKGITSREANVLNRMDELAMKYTPEELDAMMVDLQSKIAKNPRNPYKAYLQVFGEAHARNAERRSKMPFNLRRETFPESTLDVPRSELRYSDVQAEGPDLQLKVDEKPKRQSKAEAEALGLYHPVGGGVKLKRPISEMDIQIMDNPDMPLKPRKELSPEEMVGGAIIPLSMDLSSAGKIITGVGGNKLILPVKTQGGYQFMQWNGDAWSSLPNVSKRIGNQIQTAREMEGVDPDKIFGVTKTMSPTGVDFNHMTTEVLLNQFDPTTIPKPVARNFNTLMRDQGVKNQKTGVINYPFKSFEGIETPEGRAQLLEISNWGGELRKNMINKMSLKDFREAGFPDVAEARAAVSAPELLDQPIGMMGHGIARFDPSGELNLDPADPHYTYTANIKGHPTKGGYAGAFKTPVSNEIAFKNYFDTRRALDKPKSSDDRAFSMSMPIQKTNQEWLDTVMAEMDAQDRALKEGLSMDEARLAIMRKEEEPKQQSPKDELGFYSNVEKAALNLKRQSGNGQAYMNDIKKQAGVHADELEAIGLPKFLESKKTFTTPEVQEFIANNRLKVTEKKFTDADNESTDVDERLTDLTNQILDNMGFDPTEAPRYAVNEAYEKAKKLIKEEDVDKVRYGGEEYEEYMTSGGKNYRETILQLPKRDAQQVTPIDTSGWTVETLGSDPYTGQRSIKLFNENGSPVGQRSGYRGNDADAIREHVNKLQKLEQEDQNRDVNFVNPRHYTEFENVLLNLRLKDFSDVDGKQGTLIDELQSDWHQMGRDQGYKIIDTPDLKPEYDALLNKIDEKVRESVRKEGMQNGLKPELIDKLADTVVRGSTHEEKAKIADMLSEFNDINDRISNQPRTKTTGVPDAPYKERWHEIGIKKAVVDAINRGDERIYLPEGKDVANRYKLSKQISRVVFDDNISGGVGDAEMEDRGSGGTLHAYDLNGNQVIGKYIYTLEELKDLIGKDAANKLLESKAERTRSGSSGVRRRELAGIDLDVGGEGMKKYYDEIYPAVLKKLAKQYGGKFGETEIEVGNPVFHVIDQSGNRLTASGFVGQEHAIKSLEKGISKGEFPENSTIQKIGNTRKVRYYEPDEEAKVKIQGGIAMKDGGAVHMSEGGKPLTPYEQFKIDNEEKIRQGKEEIANRNKYDPYKGSGKPVPTTRPSGSAGIVPSIEPSGSGSPSLLNPLNRKNGGDVNLDAMRYALTKGK
jgi:antitoxin component of RelBE/YafQ-DinJ toxin-antitoxin module